MLAKHVRTACALVLFLPSIAIAQSLPVPVRTPGSGLSPALVAKAEQTTFMLEQAEGYCSVSPITRDGYLLTALHCVRGCLESAGAGESASNESVGLYDLFASTRSKTMGANGIACPNLSIPALGIKSVTVVETGPALASFDAGFIAAYPDLFHELQTAAFDLRANDFAILKIQMPHDLPCWPLAANAPTAGSPVWALGYPLPNDRKQAPVLSASPGRVYASALESLAYRTAMSADQQTYLVSQFSNSGIIFSNAQNEPGQSGGPVIASDGTVVGVVSGYAPTVSGHTWIHELVAPNTSFILHSLTPALATVLLQKSAACR